MNNISHPELLKEWKENLDERLYDKNLEGGAGKPSLKKKIIIIVKLIGHPVLLKIHFFLGFDDT